jgi:copper oxidase (laccase) domain-containing protein
MLGFKAGYAEVNINPPLGSLVCGYYIPRVSEGFLDDLQASALALSCNGVMTVLISVDSTELYVDACQRYGQAIEEATGIPKENITVTDLCTKCNPDVFHSHRATGGKRGIIGVFLSLK